MKKDGPLRLSSHLVGTGQKKQAARPEDFMDDEDLQDNKDSRNLVDNTEEMYFMGGAQILKKMGWRLGQVVGPRISLSNARQRMRWHTSQQQAKDTQVIRLSYLTMMKRLANTHALRGILQFYM
jgi:hypothetical protein